MKHRRKTARRHVRCTACTPNRWGNTKSLDHMNDRDRRNLMRERDEIKDTTSIRDPRI